MCRLLHVALLGIILSYFRRKTCVKSFTLSNGSFNFRLSRFLFSTSSLVVRNNRKFGKEPEQSKV